MRQPPGVDVDYAAAMAKRTMYFFATMLAVTTAAWAQAPTAASRVPDLSGAWIPRPPFLSISAADPRGEKRGNEPDITYTVEGKAKLLAAIPPTGPFGHPDKTTDPWMNYCEPNGPVRIFAHPARTTFVQLPDRVLILHEVMQQFRIVRLNGTHPPADDIAPSYWGDAIGHYENVDTLVVDIIGTNGRTWLTQSGHPTSEKLHVVERYKRVDADHMDYEALIDDPGIYTKPVTVKRALTRSNVPFMQEPWNCSVRDNTTYHDTLLGTAAK
jgi:hypothetical protein